MRGGGTTRKPCRTLLLAVLLGCANAAALDACTLCLGFPEQTPADHIVAANCVLLARPAAENPFAYAPREVLKGHFDGADIPLLVDSATRRRLHVCPQRHVVLVQAAAGGAWRSLGIASSRYERVVRRLVLLSAGGRTPAVDRDRQRLFLLLFGDTDRQTRELAYLEMGRAPYRIIRQLGRAVPRSGFAEMLQQDRYFEWRSLAILLLAQSDDVQDHQVIRDSFEARQRLGLHRHLSAWAAALIEIDGTAGIDAIESLYWQRPERRTEELTEIARALALHASEEGVSAPVVAASQRLLRQRPARIPLEATAGRGAATGSRRELAMASRDPRSGETAGGPGSAEAAGFGD